MATNNQNNNNTQKRGPGRPPGSKNKNSSKSSSSRNSSSKSKSSQTKASQTARNMTPEEEKLERIRQMQAQYDHDRRNIDVIWSITLFAVSVFLFVTVVMDTTGSFGATVHDICMGLFGIMAYVLPFFILIFALLLITRKMQHISGRTVFFTILIFLNMCILNSYRSLDPQEIRFGFLDMAEYYFDAINGKGGGALGMELGSILVKLFGMPGLLIIASTITLISIFLVANTPISRFFDNQFRKHEEKQIFKEMAAAETAKVQMAVASTATPGADPETGIVPGGVQPEVKESPIAGSAKSIWKSILNGITRTDETPDIVPSQKDQYAAIRANSNKSAPAHVEPLEAPQHKIDKVADENDIEYTKVLGVDTLGDDDGIFNRLVRRITGPVKPVTKNQEDRPVQISMHYEGVDDEDYGYPGRKTSAGEAGEAKPAVPDKPRGMGEPEPYKGKAGKQYGLGDPNEVSHSGGYGLDGHGKTSVGRGLNDSAYAGGNAAGAGNASAMKREMKDFGVTDTGLDGGYDAANANRRKRAGNESLSGKGLGEEEQKAAANKVRNKKGLATDPPEMSEEDKALADSFNAQAQDTSYVLPSAGLLKKSTGSTQMMSDYQLEEKAALLEKTLNDFNVEAHVISVTQGASVTRYEVQPATGVKVSKITSLADDIALNLKAKSIRIEAPIPGKAAVGIEVENDKPSPVLIRDLIESEEFKSAKSRISFIVGKDISGNNIIADLKEMPHLLIAGATGSGKSVCINTIITSFLYKAKPSELKLIMIDPKVVELANYNGIPHMLTPVVTDARKASRALAIAVEEMDKRYELFAKEGVKDLQSYNELMMANHEPQNRKPEVVIIIDELADLMMAAPSEVENSICRLAQKARAAGMHLIVATQRPSVDVVTGLIKANIPSRIAFSVASSFDSRTILDMTGAEKLLGKGDMLFSPVGSNKPYRVQGPYISDSETEKVIKFVKKEGGGPVYDEEISNAIESNEKKPGSEPQDELTEDAIAFILKSKQASVSMLQRRFRIGYNRAARIIDEIEEKGIIGPSDGSRPRQVLVTEEEYYGGGVNAAAAQETIDEISPQEKAELEAKVTGKPHMGLVSQRREEPAAPAAPEEPEAADDPEMPEGYIDADPEADTVKYEEVNEGTAQSAIDYFNSLPESVRKMLLNSEEQ